MRIMSEVYTNPQLWNFRVFAHSLFVVPHDDRVLSNSVFDKSLRRTLIPVSFIWSLSSSLFRRKKVWLRVRLTQHVARQLGYKTWCMRNDFDITPDHLMRDLKMIPGHKRQTTHWVLHSRGKFEQHTFVRWLWESQGKQARPIVYREKIKPLKFCRWRQQQPGCSDDEAYQSVGPLLGFPSNPVIKYSQVFIWVQTPSEAAQKRLHLISILIMTPLHGHGPWPWKSNVVNGFLESDCHHF